MTTQSAVLEGTCLCGATTLRAVPAEAHLHACHCEMCRRWTGSAFVSFPVADGNLETRGPVRTRATSDWAERSWCDACGSSLYYRLTAPGPMHGMAFVAAGLFDDAGGLSLTSEMFIDRKPAGYAFAGDHPVQTKAEFEAQFASPPEE